MTLPRSWVIGYAGIAAILVVIDEWIKRWALSALPQEGELAHPGLLSFAIHKNWGVAFDIPFKLTFIVLITVGIGAFLVHVFLKNIQSHPYVAMSALVIIIGAAGNLYDRLAYGFTVDYIILFGRSAINISDTVIVFGVLSLLFASRRIKGSEPSSHDHDHAQDEG